MHPDDLQRGDLVFCARPGGPLANLGKLAHEPWRHVGATSRNSAGEAVVVEINGNQFKHRPLDRFLGAYERYGVVRLDLPDACVTAATDAMDRVVGKPHQYAWDDLILAGIIAATQRGVLAGRRDKVLAAIHRANQRCKETPEHRGTRSLTCSGFIAIAYRNLESDCDMKFNLWRGDQLTWPQQLGTLDRFFGPDGEYLERVFSHASLVELLERTEREYRQMGDTTMQPDQAAEVLRVLLCGVAGYVLDPPSSEQIRSDGRWVTPGQIWDSPSVALRAELDVTGYRRG